LFTKNLEKDHPLHKLLNKTLEAKTVSSPQPNLDPIIWKASRYDLQKAKLFTELDNHSQGEVQKYISELNLSLSYFIEKSGHNYGAKMILLSDTIEEKSLYSLFVAEEATHLKEFTNFMNFDIDLKHHWHPMLNCLSQAIQEGEKNTLTFIIQVLLEGFGIAHYASLRDDCSNELLKKTYDQILIDEARHHGAGIILSGKAKLSKLEEDQIFEYTRMFIKALQQADWLFKATSRFTNNDITKEDKSLFYEQIGYTKKLSARLLKLKAMIAKVDQTGLIENLEREDIFTPSVPT